MIFNKAEIPGISFNSVIAIPQRHIVQLIDKGRSLIAQEYVAARSFKVKDVLDDPRIDKKMPAFNDRLKVEDGLYTMVVKEILNIRVNILIDQLTEIKHINIIGQAIFCDHFHDHPLVAAGDAYIIQEQ